jgi:hypothetical protein
MKNFNKYRGNKRTELSYFPGSDYRNKSILTCEADGDYLDIFIKPKNEESKHLLRMRYKANVDKLLKNGSTVQRLYNLKPGGSGNRSYDHIRYILRQVDWYLKAEGLAA